MSFLADLENLSTHTPPHFSVADAASQDAITVIIFTSPIPSHPHDWVLSRCYAGVRTHLPNSRIMILADGANGREPESYIQFKNLIRTRWELIDFTGWHHQTLMLKEALARVKTPLVLVGEHDWILRRQYIDWHGITQSLLDPEFPFQLIQIRQNDVAQWEYHYFGDVELHHGIHLLPTTCFQCPMHVARTDWCRQATAPLTLPKMLESDEMTRTVQKGGADRMACYIPPGRISRLYHIDGRHVLRPEQVVGCSREPGNEQVLTERYSATDFMMAVRGRSNEKNRYTAELGALGWVVIKKNGAVFAKALYQPSGGAPTDANPQGDRVFLGVGTADAQVFLNNLT